MTVQEKALRRDQEKADTDALRRRMSMEEELQQLKEQNRSLEDKVAKTEFDYKLKEVHIYKLPFFWPQNFMVSKFLASKFLALNFLASNFLISKFLASNFQASKFQASKFLTLNFLASNFLALKFVASNF